MANELVKGRIARGLALAKLAARELPGVATRVMRGEKSELDLAAVRESAERAVKVLGDLRGLALKLGQTASYVDGLLPPEATDVYQRALAKLQSGAPTVSFDEIRAEIEAAFGKPLGELYARFDEAPVAAASIGQVHRAAILRDGVEVPVAVKIQFPSIAHALGSDLKNLDSLKPMLAMMAPGADTDGGMEEFIRHIAAELDYTLEAKNQDRFRALTAGRPGMHVPEVFHHLTARNVITMEFVEGRSLRQVADDGDQALRDRVGDAIFRFTLGCAFVDGVFNTDPHPGNYLVQPDGTVSFLDFGSVKEMPTEMHARWKEVATLLVTGRHDEWRRKGAALFGMEHMDPTVRRLHQDYMLSTACMIAEDRVITIDRTLLREAVQGGIRTGKSIIREKGWIPSRDKNVALPPDFVMAGRMQVGLFAVLALLRPTANWNHILREILGAG